MAGSLAVAGVISADKRLFAAWLAAIFALQAVAILLRWLRGAMASVLVPISQAVLLVVGTVLGVGGVAADGFSPAALVQVIDQVRAGFQGGTPVPVDDGVLVASTALIGILTLLADLLFNSLRTVLGAMVPVAGPYLLAVILQPRPLPLVSFIALAAGWGLLSWSRTLDHDRRWPRRVPVAGHPWIGFSAWAVVLAVCSALAAGFAGSFISSVERDLFHGEAAQATIELVDPTVPMDESLKRPADTRVLTYTASSQRGVMLRQASLDRVSSDGWHLVDMDLKSGAPASVPGVADVGSTGTTKVQFVDLNSQYLPVPYAPKRWSASSGIWRYDPDSLSIVNVALSPDTTGLSYEVLHSDVEPSREALLAAEAGQLANGKQVQDYPAGLPDSIRSLASEITANTRTSGEAAVALQSWLRDTSRFSYNLDVSSSVSYDSLEEFLFDTHTGYCVHYASSMAVMARSLGIPSRIGVGFTTGEQLPDGSWEVTAHDAHAWPELYFRDLGWVRFEPTVSVGDDPSWSTDVMAPSDSPIPSPTPSVEPSAEPSDPAEPSQPAPTQSAESGSATPDSVTTGEGFSLGSLPWGWIGGVIAALVIAALPRLIRAVVRRRRLGGAGGELVEGVLQELRATAIDFGISWPDATLQQLADRDWGLAPKEQTALRRILLTTQQQRFAASPPSTDRLLADISAITTAWSATATVKSRLLAKWLPSSLWHRSK